MLVGAWIKRLLMVTVGRETRQSRKQKTSSVSPGSGYRIGVRLCTAVLPIKTASRNVS